MNRVTIVACGTSFYAGMVAKYWFEQFARVPVDIDVASEFRYREPVTARRITSFVNLLPLIPEAWRPWAITGVALTGIVGRLVKQGQDQ